jgi:hypothetical protein
VRPVLLATAVTVALLVFVPCAFAAKLPVGVSLRLLDGNGDGLLSPADPTFEAGLLFRDLNGNGQLGDTTAAGADLIAPMTEMNMDFLALQAAVQNENLRFTSLSNASKARRTLALNAIRNLK